MNLVHKKPLSSSANNSVDLIALKKKLDSLEISYAIINNSEEPIRLSKVLQYPLKAEATLSNNHVDQYEILYSPETLISFFNREDLIVSKCCPVILSIVS